MIGSNMNLTTSLIEKNNLTGKQYGRLVVLEFVGKKRSNNVWKCLCVCGNIVDVSQNHLGINTNSCGCLRKEMLSLKKTKHGKTHSKEFRTLSYMKARCYNPNLKCYKNYGGRGIKICDRWLDKENGFLNFFTDMGECPEGYSIERINNDGNYCPENCKWIPLSEQAKNKRNVVNLTFKGETLNMNEWSKKLNVDADTIRNRFKNGWNVEEVLFGKQVKEKPIKEKFVKTHCKNKKHLWIQENIYIRSDTGRGTCKLCMRESIKNRKNRII
jgi:hypothetical protein